MTDNRSLVESYVKLQDQVLCSISGDLGISMTILRNNRNLENVSKLLDNELQMDLRIGRTDRIEMIVRNKSNVAGLIMMRKTIQFYEKEKKELA